MITSLTFSIPLLIPIDSGNRENREIVKRSEQHPGEDCSKLQKEQWGLDTQTISALREGLPKGNNLFVLHERKNVLGFFILNIPPPEVSSCYFVLGKKIKKHLTVNSKPFKQTLRIELLSCLKPDASFTKIYCTLIALLVAVSGFDFGCL